MRSFIGVAILLPMFAIATWGSDWFCDGSQCLYRTNDPQDWRSARKICYKLDGDLVVVRSWSENMIVKVLCGSSSRPTSHCWIGLHDKNWEGRWQWIDNSHHDKYWCHGEPDNADGGSDFVVIWSGNGCWSDSPHSRQLKGICRTRGCKGCSNGYYARNQCSPWQTESCTRCSSCSAGYYQKTRCSGSQNTVCSRCSSCSSGYYQVASCSSSRNTVCSRCSSCTSGYYISQTCSSSRNTVCSRCYSCSAGYYVSRHCSSQRNTVCSTCGSCSAGYYISTPCSTNQNTVCSRCQSCDVGWYISTPCSSSQNTVCSTYTPTNTPTQIPTERPTHRPTSSPTDTPTVPPTSNPTLSPTNPCIDNYEFCSHVADNGFCFHDDDDIREETQITCALSCGTCFNGTMSPSHQPSLLPTQAPTSPTSAPTQRPSTRTPTGFPTDRPSTNTPTLTPSTKTPTLMPTNTPSTNNPTQIPSTKPSQKPSETPTKTPTSPPTGSPTCLDLIGYCGTIISACNSAHVATQAMMAKNCASTCGFCSLSPTQTPSVPCVDSYGYCAEGALAGGCHTKNNEARMNFIIDCPVSCGTCNGGTVVPTSRPTAFPTDFPTNVPSDIPSVLPSILPSFRPTAVPTNAPTCVDLIKYCEFVKSSCDSSKLQTDCAHTCGHCTEQPTQTPSTPCVDTHEYCADVAAAGGCYLSDYEAKLQFHDDCAVSCGTCHNQTVTPTVTPTFNPSYSPTTVPTTCEDVTGYCELLKAHDYCNTSSLLTKMKADCAYTCGYCTKQPASDDL